ncbi:MAG TPA: alpha-ribazole phosphatase [Rhodocyclaceae bacterium]
MSLYLIRHPRPAVAPGLCYGRSDLALAEEAAAVAAGLRPLLPLGAPIYSSPLQRCRLLADQLHATPRFDPRLQEMDFGTWEMQAWEQIERAALDAWAADPLHYRPPGGETVAELQQRVREFLAELPPGPAVLVSHGGVMKLIAAELLGLPQDEWLRLRFDYGALRVLTR